jgi:hypothetical protein
MFGSGLALRNLARRIRELVAFFVGIPQRDFLNREGMALDLLYL